MTQSVTHGMPVWNTVSLEMARKKIDCRRPTFRKKAVHHTTNKFQFVLEAKVDKVGVYENAIRGD